MIGLVLALVLAAILYLVSGQAGGVYIVVTNLLYQWYIWTSAIIVALTVVTIVGSSLHVSSLLSALGDRYFGTAILFAGGFSSVLAIIVLAITRGTLIIGALLLHLAYKLGDGWDIYKLILGVVLLAVGLYIGRSRSSKD